MWYFPRISGPIWPDWGYTTLADMAGYGRIGVYRVKLISVLFEKTKYLLQGGGLQNGKIVDLNLFFRVV